MFKNILVSLCSREQVAPVVQQAIWLARRERAHMLGLHVVDQQELVPPAGTEGIRPDHWREAVEPELKAAGQSFLDYLADECARASVPVQTKLLVGSTSKAICQQARTADLIVMGRGGECLRRGDLLGCCPLEGVVRHSRRPVLAVGAQPRPIERILVAYDGSHRASTALAMAARLACEWQVELLLLTVVEKGLGKEVLAEGQAYLAPYGLAGRALLRDGTPAVEILDASAEEDADLIVMGTYCHNRVQELVFGGTVGEVVRKAGCPVLIGC